MLERNSEEARSLLSLTRRRGNLSQSHKPTYTDLHTAVGCNTWRNDVDRDHNCHMRTRHTYTHDTYGVCACIKPYQIEI